MDAHDSLVIEGVCRQKGLFCTTPVCEDADSHQDEFFSLGY